MSAGDTPDDGLTRDERFLIQTTEQYASLGKFVQAYEHMVDAFRTAIVFNMPGGVYGQQLAQPLVFHPAMTAKPLFEVMRAQFSIRLDEIGDRVDPDERRVTDAALTYLAGECDKLFSIRNTLIHGTWRIGWVGADQHDFSEMNVYKFNVKSSGVRLADTPKSAKELDALTARCDAARNLVERISGAYFFPNQPRVRFNIRQEGNVWVAEPPMT